MGPAGAASRRTQRSQTTGAIAVAVLCVALLVGIGVWDSSTGASDSEAEPDVDQIEVFTFVATGIVYVDPRTSTIVWKNADGDQRTIGADPWRNRGETRPSELTGSPAWRDDRDIVGNPDHDLVSWVETTRGTRGDLVVVKASTGGVLARARIPAPIDRHIVIASLDDESVYFATPDPATGFPDMPGPDIWTWSWADGSVPEVRTLTRYYNDVSAGRWALYDAYGVEFADTDRRSVFRTNFNGTAFTDFGGALSPDGRYWYGSGSSQIVDTATGYAVELPASRERNYGWTGAAELTLTRPYLVCSAVSGRCRGPASSPVDLCLPYAITCGNHLPVN